MFDGSKIHLLSNHNVMSTPPKINIEPENDGLEDVFPCPGVYSQVPAVNLPGCILHLHLVSNQIQAHVQETTMEMIYLSTRKNGTSLVYLTLYFTR